MTREAAIKRIFLQFAAAYAVILLIIVREELAGVLSPRGLAIVGLLCMVGGWSFLTLKLRAINRNFKLSDQPALDSSDPAIQKKIMRSVRTLRVGLIMMPVFLIYGLSVTSGLPTALRIIGAAMNLFITWSIYRALRYERAKLQQLGNSDLHRLSNAPKL
jgi:TRAP-type C4-dicarboxylate transport system permease large subunit